MIETFRQIAFDLNKEDKLVGSCSTSLDKTFKILLPVFGLARFRWDL